MTPTDIVDFWTQSGPKRWFAKSDAFDDQIRTRFEPVHHAAARGEFALWEGTAEGCLALLLLLDQVPRNLYRDSAHAFATDPLARRLAKAAVGRGLDQEVPAPLRVFIYMPFMHSEAMDDQGRSIRLFRALAADPGEEPLRFAVLHREIVRRFGRFPHRNAALGRKTTREEQAFLDEGGFAG